MTTAPLDISVNGKWLAATVPGFTILEISGRELNPLTVKTQSIEGRDGSVIMSKQKSSRTIKLKFHIYAPNNATRGSRFNQLASLLDCGETEIIFSDEPDKFYKAIRTSGSEDSITFYCTDPLKYATTLKEFTASKVDGALTCTVNNAGTQPAVIDYEITNPAENGYIGIASQNGAMEYGAKEEADKEKSISNQQLLNLQNFISASNDTNGTDYLYPNDGVKGTMTTHIYTFPSGYSGTYLGFGSAGTLKGSCSGGLRTLTLPADGGGSVGAKNWYCYLHAAIWAGAMGQTGSFSVAFLTSDNRVIAGLRWYKTDCSGNTGHYDLIGVDGRVLHTYSFETHHLQERNPFTDSWGHCDIRKEGSKLTYFWWGQYPSYVMPEAADLVCTKIQVTAKQYGSRSGDKVIDTMGIDALRFEKLGVENWVDVPNRYAAGTKIEIDGTTSKILVNGMPRPEDEVLGTTYFKAPPGETELKFYTSSWCTGTPTVIVRIREAWL